MGWPKMIKGFPGCSRRTVKNAQDLLQKILLSVLWCKVSTVAQQAQCGLPRRSPIWPNSQHLSNNCRQKFPGFPGCLNSNNSLVLSSASRLRGSLDLWRAVPSIPHVALEWILDPFLYTLIFFPTVQYFHFTALQVLSFFILRKQKSLYLSQC